MPKEIALPNGRKVQLVLQGLTDGVASVQVEIGDAKSPLKTVIRLGREGKVYQHAGRHDGGKLILVLSSP